MKRNFMYIGIFSLMALASMVGYAAESPYEGRWAFTTPGGGAGWLGVDSEEGFLDAEILWSGGSVVPIAGVMEAGERLMVTRNVGVNHRDDEGKVIRTHMFQNVLFFEKFGDTLECTMYSPDYRNKTIHEHKFTANRIPPLPDAPDLSEVEYGEPIELFNEKNLEGWMLTNEHATNGWSVKDGVLVNNPEQKQGEPHIHYGNLRTVDEFEDFNLTLDVKVPENGNSGIYLRGIYEVQVMDSYGRPLDSHHMGAIYSRITPSKNAEKPAGEWQTFDITLCDRHVTVILNGIKIIDNHPLLGITGGALTSNEFEPGPIYLQGDHTAVSYRNMVLKPIIEKN